MNKRQPKAKTVATKSQPDQEQIVRHPHSATQPPFEVPLDILCDIAWRLSHSKGSGEIDMGQWCQNVLRAYDLIWAANNLRRDKGNQHTSFEETRLASEARLRDRLTDIELGTDHVGFERACLVLDQSKDKRTSRSINKFLNACENGLLDIIWRTLEDVQVNGFDLAELNALERRLKALPKTVTHAKYGSNTEASKKKRRR